LRLDTAKQAGKTAVYSNMMVTCLHLRTYRSEATPLSVWIVRYRGT